MSILETPRVYFKGEIAWDPIVTNNYAKFYDESTGEVVLPDAVDKVKAFRDEAIAAVIGGNWNPHGTHRSTFYDTAVSGVDVGAGTVTSDPFVASAASFSGMLVDLEPYGAFSSQLFFDTLQLGVDGGYRILGKRSSRATARYINFTRNGANSMIAGVASVVWQTCFSKADGLAIDAFDSPVLKALAAALQANDVLGLTVRFNAYRTIYYDDPELSNTSPATRNAAKKLTDKLLEGGFQPNPARSVVVGVVGLWRQGEPVHEPGDRALLGPTGSAIASAHARIDGNKLTLDLANSVPEVSRDLVKANLGPLSLVAVSSAGVATDLGTLSYGQYDRAAYEASSGIAIVPLNASQVASATSGDLQIRDAHGKVFLSEVALRAIPSTPNLYLDEGASTTATFQIYDRGRPARGPLPVTMYTMSSDGSTIESKAALQSDECGVLSLPIQGTKGAIVAYVPAPDPTTAPTSQGIDTQLNTYMYVRTLPADADVAALPPTWANVYARVLANWNALAPCMDNWLRLDDPEQVRAYAAILKRLTDPARFEDFRFMPVTRDMTAGERKLLYAFLDAPVAAAALHAAAAPKPPSPAALSRAMRRPT